jgi:hypothetical protein
MNAISHRIACSLSPPTPTKEECLSKVILFGERFLRQALSEYIDQLP